MSGTTIHDLVNEKNDKEMLKVFEVLNQPIRATMSESYFVTNFLPFLKRTPIPEEDINQMLFRMEQQTGQKHTEKDLIANMIGHWIERVGSVYYECDVQDETGKTIYTVPPLCDDYEVFDQFTSEHIAAILEHANKQAEIIPDMGTQYLLDNVVNRVQKNTNGGKYVEAWNKIYAYYGLPKFGEDLNNPQVGRKDVIAKSVEEAIFDEFPDDF